MVLNSLSWSDQTVCQDHDVSSCSHRLVLAERKCSMPRRRTGACRRVHLAAAAVWTRSTCCCCCCCCCCDFSSCALWTEFNDKVQLFLPGALGWEVPKSGIISEFDLYQVLSSSLRSVADSFMQQAAWGMMQIQKLHQFEYLESVQLFDKVGWHCVDRGRLTRLLASQGEIDEYDLERLFYADEDEETEVQGIQCE